MLKNFLKTTFRNLWKNKTYSFLNIFGLAIGITCAGLIFLWVEDEVNFNHNFANKDYLYHVMQNETNDGKISTNGSTPGPLAAAMKKEIPGIKNSGRLSWAMDELVVIGDKSIKGNGIYADPSVLQMYALPFVQGSATTAFKQSQSIVLSESFAQSIFGNDNPMGKTIKMNIGGAYSVDGLYTVTGVYKDLPPNASYKFKWISPYAVWENANTWLKPWNNDLTETIVQLDANTDPSTVDKQLVNYLATKSKGNTAQCFLFSMNDWNLRNHFENGKIDGGKIKYVHLFSLIAAIILLIACINFMNLATARSEKRAKEVGVLKVMGAGKSGLIGKFISESLCMSFMAVLLAVGLLYLLLPGYNTLVQKDLSIDIFKPSHLFSLLGIGIVAGLTAGSYPAIYLSSFNPAKVLKGIGIKGTAGAGFVRKGLVVTQFTISIILIICTAIIYQQVQHIKNRDIGYSKNDMITMDLQGNLKKNFSIVKNQLISTGYVENTTMALHTALQIYSYGSGYDWQGKEPNSKIDIHSNVVTPEYLSTMHMQLLSGRDFYSTRGIDSDKVIINESMAKLMGKAGKIGSFIRSGPYSSEVVGIVKNFVYNDMYGPPAPLILYCYGNGATVMTIRFKPNVSLTDALAKTEAVMKAENPGYPFEYQFVDEAFNQYFSNETFIGKLAAVFAVLAVFISCLGLFGLAAYTAERRTKEIGIRKVLGASIQGLVSMLSKEFIQLVSISCIIAFPVSWWAMHVWLQDYAYRTDIQWWVFGIAGISALGIALVTVSFQAVKAAMANPVKGLRSE